MITKHEETTKEKRARLVGNTRFAKLIPKRQLIFIAVRIPRCNIFYTIEIKVPIQSLLSGEAKSYEAFCCNADLSLDFLPNLQ
jgi:hypothetical protein